jgi:transcriptional regulator with XRE-family HTH domain
VNAFGEAMKARREAGGMKQTALAARIGRAGDKYLISKLESGRRVPDVELAARIDAALEAGGELIRLAGPEPAWMEALVVEDVSVDLDSRVVRDQDEWRATREVLNRQRPALARAAAALYPDVHQLAGTGLLTHPSWLPDTPVDLSEITLTYRPEALPPTLDGTEAKTSHVRPRQSLTEQFPRYTSAIRELAHPRLFENRFSWRLDHVSWDDGGGRLGFAPTTYFAAMDVSEAVAHEVAHIAVSPDGTTVTAPSMRELPFRKLIGDPFDLRHRPVLASISTLTVRRGAGDDVSFVLHRRDSKSVAIGGGMLHVMPCGVFQPSSVLPEAMAGDFDLWRNMMREFSEEFFGNPEHDGDGGAADYTAEPFATFDAARQAGRLRTWMLGVGLDALTLPGELLTVAIFDADLFDRLARDFVATNTEGTIVQERVPFNAESVKRLLDSGRMAPAGAGLLELAWQHRDTLLG